MTFSDKIALKFRKRGLSGNEINNRLRTYYFYSKILLWVYLFGILLLVGFNKLKTADHFAIILFFIWFVVCLRIFLSLRRCIRVLN